mmetsp:Transcript_10036/g.13773  ORF Transcript_10036/g.13773 Transcript_10036/m.13773 type:complete len:555 (-) Transcript_10036:2073-3737(-)
MMRQCSRQSINNPFSLTGIRLIDLDAFVTRCGGEEALKSLTTDVCQSFIKPLTVAEKCSYVELLSIETSTDRSAVNFAATVFVSHTWKSLFLDVLKTLRYHFRDEPEAVLWMDVFCANQQSNRGIEIGAGGAEWLTGPFKAAVQQLNRTVLVLAPWSKSLFHLRGETDVAVWLDMSSMASGSNESGGSDGSPAKAAKPSSPAASGSGEQRMAWSEPCPLSRTWCLFEAFCAVERGGGLELALAEDLLTGFLLELKRSGHEAVDRLLALVSIERSDCSLQVDKECLLLAVRQGVTAGPLNSLVIGAVRQWAMDAVLQVIAREQDEVARADYKAVIAKMFEAQGRFAQAETLLSKCLALRRNLLPPEHIDTLSCMNSLALLQQKMGQYGAAEALYEQCLGLQRTKLGPEHPDTVATLNNLATLHDKRGEYELAEELYTRCFDLWRHKLGPEHPHTLGAMSNVAALHQKKGDYDKAEPLLGECLRLRTAHLGPDHPHTLASMNNLAALCQKKGDFAQAEKLFLECLSAQKTHLGEAGPPGQLLIPFSPSSMPRRKAL